MASKFYLRIKSGGTNVSSDGFTTFEIEDPALVRNGPGATLDFGIGGGALALTFDRFLTTGTTALQFEYFEIDDTDGSIVAYSKYGGGTFRDAAITSADDRSFGDHRYHVNLAARLVGDPSSATFDPATVLPSTGYQHVETYFRVSYHDHPLVGDDKNIWHLVLQSDWNISRSDGLTDLQDLTIKTYRSSLEGLMQDNFAREDTLVVDVINYVQDANGQHYLLGDVNTFTVTTSSIDVDIIGGEPEDGGSHQTAFHFDVTRQSQTKFDVPGDDSSSTVQAWDEETQKVFVPRNEYFLLDSNDAYQDPQAPFNAIPQIANTNFFLKFIPPDGIQDPAGTGPDDNAVGLAFDGGSYYPSDMVSFVYASDPGTNHLGNRLSFTLEDSVLARELDKYVVSGDYLKGVSAYGVWNRYPDRYLERAGFSDVHIDSTTIDPVTGAHSYTAHFTGVRQYFVVPDAPLDTTGASRGGWDLKTNASISVATPTQALAMALSGDVTGADATVRIALPQAPLGAVVTIFDNGLVASRTTLANIVSSLDVPLHLASGRHELKAQVYDSTPGSNPRISGLSNSVTVGVGSSAEIVAALGQYKAAQNLAGIWLTDGHELTVGNTTAIADLRANYGDVLPKIAGFTGFVVDSTDRLGRAVETHYSPAGTLSGVTVHNVDGSLFVDRTIETDAQGHRVATIFDGSFLDDKPYARVASVYSAGDLIEKRFANADGSSFKVVTYGVDADGHRSATVHDGTFFDGRSYVALTSVYDADGSVAVVRYHRADGTDLVRGGSGDDHVMLEAGDRASGAAGMDHFILTAASGAGPRITITDFTPGTDVIDLSRIDTDAGATGDQPFVFLDGRAFTHHAGEVRTIEGNVTTILVDLDGDARADVVIALLGHPHLTASDFSL